MCFNKKPKIAIISLRNSYSYGGVLSSLKVAYQFCERYFQPTVFFLSFDAEISTSLKRWKFSSSVRQLSYFGMNCIEIGTRWSFWEPGHYSFTLPYWKELLKDYDYFLVVSGTCIAAHPLMQLNKPFTLWIGTPYDEDRAERVKNFKGFRAVFNRLAHKKMISIEKQILKKSRFTWPISTYAQSQFQRMLHEKPSNMLLCGYPINYEHPLLNTPPKENIVVAVGRFSDPRKNIDMLMRVFDQLYKHMPQLHLYIIGLKPSNDKMFEYSENPSFAHVTFTGQVSSNDLHTMLERAKIMLITSHQEGLGIVGLEALLHGTPVIATDCGGTQDFVINGKTGYLVACNDDQAMVEKTLLVLQSPDLYRNLSQNGKLLIEEQFSLHTTYDRFKYGLCYAYPELKAWFEEYDNHHDALIKARHKTTVQGSL